MKKEFSVGRNDGTDTPRFFGTLAEAEAEIARIEEVDPAGVKAGEYFIDAPEGSQNG
jgi:hypothetical protein